MARLAVLLIAAFAGAAVRAAPLEDFRSQAAGWLLAGQGLPRDYRVTLMQMPVDDRLQAIAYLRRIGLLTERPWPLDDLLRPADPATEPKP